jgi:hypothetical protein
MPELFLYSSSSFPLLENTTRRPRGGNGLTLRNETALPHDQRNGNSQRIVAHTVAQRYARNDGRRYIYIECHFNDKSEMELRRTDERHSQLAASIVER